MGLGIKSGINWKSIALNGGGGGGGVQFLLDEYPNASSAYSLRYLRADYVGSPVIRVRRALDNAEQNFTVDEITDGTLVAFASGGSCYVTTWYDQSGLGYNLTNSTALQQPRIVVNGTVLMDNDKPYMNYLGTQSQGLWNTRGVYNSYVFMIYNGLATGTQTQHTLLGGASANQYLGQMLKNSTLVSYLEISTPTIYKNGVELTSITQNDLYDAFVKSKDELATIKINTGLDDLKPFTYFYSSYWNGNCKVKELVIYSTSNVTDKSGIENNINAEYSIY